MCSARVLGGFILQWPPQCVRATVLTWQHLLVWAMAKVEARPMAVAEEEAEVVVLVVVEVVLDVVEVVLDVVEVVLDVVEEAEVLVVVEEAEVLVVVEGK